MLRQGSFHSREGYSDYFRWVANTPSGRAWPDPGRVDRARELIHIFYEKNRIGRPPFVQAAGGRLAQALEITPGHLPAEDLQPCETLLTLAISAGDWPRCQHRRTVHLGIRTIDEESAEEAASLAANDPAIFDAWANDDPAAWIDKPELKAWPGAYRDPVLFLDGDPFDFTRVSSLI